MKKITLFLLVLLSANLSAQKDSLQLGDSYLEDQLYFGITYNQLYNQPDAVIGSGFSYGLTAGYIRDISLVESGRVALGIGAGYAFNSYNHGYKVSSQGSTVVIEVDPSITTTNGLKIHSLEFPFEIRWRTSDANKYKFWRVYTGFKLSYNLKNSIEDASNNIFSDFERFNKVQYGLTLAAGYSTFNFSLYYGLTPLFKDSSFGTNSINTKQLKLGILFYIL